MMLYQDRYRVESARLQGWNYSAAGYYFVTICTRERECFLGEVRGGAVQLSPQGLVVAEEWKKSGVLRDNVELDAWVIMPNHLHGIIAISNKMNHLVETPRRGVLCNPKAPDCRVETPQQETPQRGVSTGAGRLVSGSLGAIIGQFKAACTKRIWASGHDFAWQSRFHEHIIRDEKTLHNIREYIAMNPLTWESDRNHPANITP